jgi:hypothetical protein
LEEIIIFQDFVENEEVANASPSQEDPYLSLCKDFKFFACLVSGIMVLQSGGVKL